MKAASVDLIKAVKRVQNLIEGEKIRGDVMIQFGGENSGICYSNGSKTVYSRFSFTECDGERAVVVDFPKLESIVIGSASKGNIVTEYIEMEIVDEKVIKFTIPKEVKVNVEGKDEFIDGGKSSVQIGYKTLDSDLRSKLYAKIDYEELKWEPEINEDALSKEYDAGMFLAGEIVKAFSKVIGDPRTMIYMSPQLGRVFSTGAQYYVEVPMVDTSVKMITYSSEAKAIMGMLSTIKEDEDVKVEIKNSTKIVISTEEFTVTVDMQKGSATMVNAFKSYYDTKFNALCLDMHKELFLSQIDMISNFAKVDKVSLSIDTGDGVIKFGVSTSSSSEKNNAEVTIEGLLEGEIEENRENLMQYSIYVKTLREMVAKCDTPYFAMDLSFVNAKGKALRIGEIDINNRYEQTKVAASAAGVEPKDLEMSVKMGIRERSIGTKAYTMVE